MARRAWLHVVPTRGLPVEPLPGGARLLDWMQRPLRAQLQVLLEQPDAWLAVGRPNGLALALCAANQGQCVLYDVMDDMPQFSRGLSRRWMCHMHEALLAQAQAVWGSSDSMLLLSIPTSVRLYQVVRFIVFTQRNQLGGSLPFSRHFLAVS